MLAPVDRVEVTVVIDNFLDLLMAGEAGVVRYQAGDLGAAEQLVAEHGFSALVTVERDGDRRTVLYDAGLTPHAVARNLDVLQVPVGEIRAIVISHGHADHHGGLEGLIRRRGRSRLPLVIHDVGVSGGSPFPLAASYDSHRPADKTEAGLEGVEERAHSLLLDGAVWLHGERAPSSKPASLHEARERGGWQPDPMIWDEALIATCAMACDIPGCSHAGVIASCCTLGA